MLSSPRVAGDGEQQVGHDVADPDRRPAARGRAAVRPPALRRTSAATTKMPTVDARIPTRVITLVVLGAPADEVEREAERAARPRRPAAPGGAPVPAGQLRPARRGHPGRARTMPTQLEPGRLLAARDAEGHRHDRAHRGDRRDHAHRPGGQPGVVRRPAPRHRTARRATAHGQIAERRAPVPRHEWRRRAMVSRPQACEPGDHGVRDCGSGSAGRPGSPSCPT